MVTSDCYQLVEMRSLRCKVVGISIDHGFGFVPTEYRVVFELNDPKFKKKSFEARVTKDEYESVSVGDLVGVDMYSYDGRKWAGSSQELETGKEPIGIGITNPFQSPLILSHKYG